MCLTWVINALEVDSYELVAELVAANSRKKNVRKSHADVGEDGRAVA